MTDTTQYNPPHTAETDPPDPAPITYLNRDLSWLEFNRRVLHEALDHRTPLLSRLMFLGIFSSNMDEFYMKRVGLLRRRLDLSLKEHGEDRDGTAKLLADIRDIVMPMLQQQADCFTNDIEPTLQNHGIHLLRYDQLSDEERTYVEAYFQDCVFPVLTPLSVDPGHPFPFLSNLSTSLAVSLRYPQEDEKVFVRIKIPDSLPQWVLVNPDNTDTNARRFIGLQDMITNHLERLLPGMRVDAVLPFRVTRGAGVDLETEEGADLLEKVEEELRLRRLQKVVRLVHGPNPDPWLLNQVVTRLQLSSDQVQEMPDDELDFTRYNMIASLKTTNPEARYEHWSPVIRPALVDEDANFFSLIRNDDLLVHHPYESFDATVARFIHAAVHDPDVLAIKMTVYRTSDDSPFMPLLIEAAEAGKQVVCLVELKARFDEHRNIRWAHALEDAGVHVVYGILGIKTHCKVATVVRKEANGIRSYCHIGTGNYNPQTAKLYTDLGLFTANPAITRDIAELFNHLTGPSAKSRFERLLVAPMQMKQRFLDLIERERLAHLEGKPAHIVAKMNALEDRKICQALCRASMAGVPIDLIVRGFCVLPPGVPEFSPTIRVISVVGRFLEHSRIFYFRNGAENPADGEFYIGSADWMYRNLEERVEAVVPIETPDHKQRLWHILDTMLNDQRQAWDMQANGVYTQRQPTDANPHENAIGTHRALMAATQTRIEALKDKL